MLNNSSDIIEPCGTPARNALDVLIHRGALDPEAQMFACISRFKFSH